jgi:hypothetical protein
VNASSFVGGASAETSQLEHLDARGTVEWKLPPRSLAWSRPIAQAKQVIETDSDFLLVGPSDVGLHEYTRARLQALAKNGGSAPRDLLVLPDATIGAVVPHGGQLLVASNTTHEQVSVRALGLDNTLIWQRDLPVSTTGRVEQLVASDDGLFVLAETYPSVWAAQLALDGSLRGSRAYDLQGGAVVRTIDGDWLLAGRHDDGHCSYAAEVIRLDAGGQPRWTVSP